MTGNDDPVLTCGMGFQQSGDSLRQHEGIITESDNDSARFPGHGSKPDPYRRSHITVRIFIHYDPDRKKSGFGGYGLPLHTDHHHDIVDSAIQQTLKRASQDRSSPQIKELLATPHAPGLPRCNDDCCHVLHRALSCVE
jgi:hypothetical protein